MAGTDVIKLDDEGFTHEEVAVLYHASFYLTNGELPQPTGPTPAMRAQIKLANALGEVVPEEQMQLVRATIEAQEAVMARRAEQFAQQHPEKGLPAQVPPRGQ